MFTLWLPKYMMQFILSDELGQIDLTDTWIRSQLPLGEGVTEEQGSGT